MKFTQIRNATAIIEFAGKKFLIDPMLAEKGAYPGFPGTLNSEIRNPRTDLPVDINKLLQVDAVIITHTHLDHWDAAAQELLPKEILIFVQNENDRKTVSSQGFSNIRILDDLTDFEGVTLIKTKGQHGSDKVMEARGEIMGVVSGVVFKHPLERVVYVAGDTVWNSFVEESIKKYSPEIIILNSGDAQAVGLGSIIMDAQDVHSVHAAAPNATLIATHMEAVNHAVLSRKELREYTMDKSFDSRVLIPEDGETIIIQK